MVTVAVQLLFMGLVSAGFAQQLDHVSRSPSRDPHVLSRFVVSADDVRQAVQKTTEPPQYSEILTYIQSRSKETSRTSTRNAGVDLVNESVSVVVAFYDLTRLGSALDLQASEKLKKVRTLSGECDRVLCFVQRLWGEELGAKMLYLKLKYGFNLSEIAFPQSDAFTLDEVNDILMAVGDLPDSFVPFGQNKQLTHFRRGAIMDYPKRDEHGLEAHLPELHPDPVANAVMMFFDRWTELDPWMRQYAVFHEMAHNFSEQLGGLDSSPEWKQLVADPNCSVSDYGDTNRWEDFAESVSAYRYFPERLCSAKYEYIKEKVFRGQEYRSSEGGSLLSRL